MEAPASPGRIVRGGSVLRERRAGVSFGRLEQIRATQSMEPESGGSIELDLFPDVSLKAIALRSAPTPRGYSLAGRLDGIPYGTVTLVVNGDVVIGTVRTPTATYAIEPAGAGSVHVRQVDPSSLPPPAEPLPAPRPSQAVSGRDGRRRPGASGTSGADSRSRDDLTVVDTLVVYTPTLRKEMGGQAETEALIDLIMAESNQALADSGAELRLFLTRTGEVDYLETGNGAVELDRLRLPDDGYMDEAHEWREETGADLVQLQVANSDRGGVAYVPGLDGFPEGADFQFSVAHYLGGSLVAVHEMGHNFGLLHDRLVTPGTPATEYAHGYVNQLGLNPDVDQARRWLTIMAYDVQCRSVSLSCSYLQRFSNPNQEHLGDRLGVPEGTRETGPSGPADSVRALNEERGMMSASNAAVTDLNVRASLSARTLQPDDPLTVETLITNRGGVESPATQGTWYRSGDPMLGPGDAVLGTFEIEGVPGRDRLTQSVELRAPAESGNHYYGVCVEPVGGERDLENNCSPGIRATVGPTVSIADARAEEGSPVEFTVTLSQSRPSAVEIRWEVAPGQALADVDYRPGDEAVLVIPAGAVEGTIHVETIEDEAVEGSDTFSVRLLDATPPTGDGAVLSIEDSDATGTIDDDDGEPVIADAGLEDAIRWELGKAPEDPISADDLQRLTQLRAWSRGIESLEGLEAATNLRSVQVHFNGIDDLSPLEHLAALEKLRIDGNPVADLKPLASLPSLTELRMDRMGFSNLEQLASLPGLRTLSLRDNGISNLSPLSDLRQLENLDLGNNAVADLSPLRELPHLTFLILTNNKAAELGPLGGLAGLRKLHLQRNGITDISALAGLEVLDDLNLRGNRISDIEPLADVPGLTRLNLADNQIRDIGPLAALERLAILDLTNNRVSSIEPIVDLEFLLALYLANNDIQDIEPLARLKAAPPWQGPRHFDLSDNAIADLGPLLTSNSWTGRDTIIVTGNPLNEDTVGTDIPTLWSRGVTVTYIDMSVAVGSAIEGQTLSFPVRLTLPPIEDVVVHYRIEPVSAEEGTDYTDAGSGTLTIAAGNESATIDLFTNEDEVPEATEAVSVTLAPPAGGFAGGVKIAHGTGAGIIADSDDPAWHAPLFPAASHDVRQGFLRIFNLGRYGAVHLDAIDDAGRAVSAPLAIRPNSTKHINSQDLAFGNVAKGLLTGVGDSDGDRRLEVRGDAIAAATFMRTQDGFLTSLHDIVPKTPDGYAVAIFNPADNTKQESLLRLTNTGPADAEVMISGTDDLGVPSPGQVRLNLEAGTSRTISAHELESGEGLDGALGTGTGKWRLLVDSNQDLRIASLMSSPTGHLTNLSTIPVADDSTTQHLVPLFPSASDPKSRQGFVRVINRGDAGTVEITARDDSGGAARTTTLSMSAEETVHFNSEDLETGNPKKGLSPGIGAGEGDWWLELATQLDVDALTYMRRLNDHFLTSMHDSVRASPNGDYVVFTFNPASNNEQASWLRLINRGESAANVAIFGVDDEHQVMGPLQLAIPGYSAVNISAPSLEGGDDGLTGSIGDGTGKWILAVQSDAPIVVMSLLESHTGHLTNLSTIAP